MKLNVVNAFTRSRRGCRAPDGDGPAGSNFAPLRAAIQKTPFGWCLELSPMQAVDAMWQRHTSPDALTGGTLLMGVEQSVWTDGERPLPISTIADRLGIEVIQTLDCDCLLFDEVPLQQMLGLLETTMLRAVRIDGPVEPMDAQAIRRARVLGRQPLEAELRAFAAIDVRHDRAVTLHARRFQPVLDLIGQNMRHYMAAILQQPVECFSAPPDWQLQRLLSCSGRMTIRPSDTQVLATSVDVGICTNASRIRHPPDRSLIYDRPSDTWHDEP
jgi:hypothetical protein